MFKGEPRDKTTHLNPEVFVELKDTVVTGSWRSDTKLLPVSSKSVENFIQFAVQAGRSYLGAGGPTSRMEIRLQEVGASLDLEVEVFATPTGVFVSARKRGDSGVVTSLGRILTSSTDLAELVRLERIFDGLQSGDYTLAQAHRLAAYPFRSQKTERNFRRISYFVMAFAASFATYGQPVSAIMSGVLCLIVSYLDSPIAEQLGSSQIFRDFVGSAFALMASGFLSQILQLPAHSFAIGTLVLIVPGLTITNAISELAEQNFVSGTAKMMKGLLVLLAMGTAYLLVTDLSRWLMPGLDFQITKPETVNSSLAVLLTCQALVILSFAIIFRVPARYLPLTLIPGLTSWFVFNSMGASEFIALRSFLPAASVGLISFSMGRLFKVPSQIFSVPGVLSLLPGLLALSTFYSVGPNADHADPAGTFLKVAIIASSIVFGLLTARIPFSKRHT